MPHSVMSPACDNHGVVVCTATGGHRLGWRPVHGDDGVHRRLPLQGGRIFALVTVLVVVLLVVVRCPLPCLSVILAWPWWVVVFQSTPSEGGEIVSIESVASMRNTESGFLRTLRRAKVEGGVGKVLQVGSLREAMEETFASEVSKRHVGGNEAEGEGRPPPPPSLCMHALRTSVNSARLSSATATRPGDSTRRVLVSFLRNCDDIHAQVVFVRAILNPPSVLTVHTYARALLGPCLSYHCTLAFPPPTVLSCPVLSCPVRPCPVM